MIMALILMLGPQCAWARGVSGTEEIETVESAPKKWAIIIGVHKYEDNGLADLPNTQNDARELYDVLTTAPDGFPEKNVLLMLDDVPERRPTRSRILANLNRWISDMAPEDTLLFYFAGHGVESDGELYLMPSDAHLGLSLDDTAIEFGRVLALIDKQRVGKQVLILDACQSGTGDVRAEKVGIRNIGRMTPEFEERIKAIHAESKGRILLASCRADQFSYEYADQKHGAFTYFLIRALRGEGDRDGNGYVSADEMGKYTWEETKNWAKKTNRDQVPQLHAHGVEGEIFLVKKGDDIIDPPPPPGRDCIFVTTQADFDGMDGRIEVARAGAAQEMPNRFRDNGDGTVYDSYLKVEWAKTVPRKMKYWEARAYCDSLTLGGKRGWRMPTREEMQTLILLRTDGEMSIDTHFFDEPDDASIVRYWVQKKKNEKKKVFNSVYFTVLPSKIEVNPQEEENYLYVLPVREAS